MATSGAPISQTTYSIAPGRQPLMADGRRVIFGPPMTESAERAVAAAEER